MHEMDTETGVKDRKLGDEWLDWDGATGPGENEIDEKPDTFLLLAASSVLILTVLIGLGWYLVKPRIDQMSLVLSTVIGWSVLVVAAVMLALTALETTLLLKLRTSLLPYAWAEKLLLSLLPKSMWLGTKLGMSKDAVGNSFIKTHNLLLKSHAREVDAGTFLVLLPRCLQKEARKQVAERVNGRAVQIVTVGGGEEARKAIRQFKPSLILAVACERDLVSGIRDVARKMHVLAIPNRRPEGPCKNTRIRLDALDDALTFIAGREDKAR